MRVDEVRALGNQDLAKELAESQRELLNLRLRWATRQLANFREIGKVRKKIARLKTIMRERQLTAR